MNSGGHGHVLLRGGGAGQLRDLRLGLCDALLRHRRRPLARLPPQAQRQRLDELGGLCTPRLNPDKNRPFSFARRDVSAETADAYVPLRLRNISAWISGHGAEPMKPQNV